MVGYCLSDHASALKYLVVDEDQVVLVNLVLERKVNTGQKCNQGCNHTENQTVQKYDQQVTLVIPKVKHVLISKGRFDHRLFVFEVVDSLLKPTL